MTPIKNTTGEPEFEISIGQTADTLQPLCGTFDFHWTKETLPEFLNKTFRAQAYRNEYVTCVGLEAHFVSAREAEDNDLVHKGDFRQHWRIKRYVRYATAEETAARKAKA